MKRITARLLAAAAILSLPAAASAHRAWMLPSGTVFSGTQSWVTVDSAVSNDLFYFDHQPGRTEGVKVWQPDGSAGKIQNASTGRYRSVFDVQLDKPGTWKVGTENSSVSGTFKVDGVEKRVGGRRGPPPGAPGAGGPGGPQAAAQRPAGAPPAGAQPQREPPVDVKDIPANATDIKLTEALGRNEIFVTAGEPTKTVFTPTGKGLELEPVTHPTELVAGEGAKFRFLVDGKPAAGLKVAVVPGGKRYRDAENGQELTTGADGVLAVTFPTAGMYWINTSHSDNKPTAPRATARRMSYTTTVEVMTP